MYLIAVGNPLDGGVEFVGTFETERDAERYAGEHFADKEWNVLPMTEKEER
jgi:hypothetical protein